MPSFAYRTLEGAPASFDPEAAEFYARGRPSPDQRPPVRLDLFRFRGRWITAALVDSGEGSIPVPQSDPDGRPWAFVEVPIEAVTRWFGQVGRSLPLVLRMDLAWWERLGPWAREQVPARFSPSPVPEFLPPPAPEPKPGQRVPDHPAMGGIYVPPALEASCPGARWTFPIPGGGPLPVYDYIPPEESDARPTIRPGPLPPKTEEPTFPEARPDTTPLPVDESGRGILATISRWIGRLRHRPLPEAIGRTDPPRPPGPPPSPPDDTPGPASIASPAPPPPGGPTSGRTAPVVQAREEGATDNHERIRDYLKSHPKATSRGVGEALGIPEQTVRNSPAWKQRSSPPMAKPREPRTGQLSHKILAARPSGEPDPAEVVEEVDLLEREYLESVGEAERAAYHKMEPDGRPGFLWLWKEGRAPRSE